MFKKCPCGSPATHLYKNINICESCFKIESVPKKRRKKSVRPKEVLLSYQDMKEGMAKVGLPSLDWRVVNNFRAKS